MAAKQRQRVTDDSQNKYFHILPNMADDDLTPYEYRLLGHYIRVHGCWESVRTTAKITRMSVGMVVKTRNRLEDLGYVTVQLSAYDTCFVTVIDRMAENIARYTKPAETCSYHEQGVHTMNTPSARGVHQVNQRRTIQEEQTEEEKAVVVPLRNAESGEVVFQTETLQPISEHREGTDTTATVEADLLKALRQHLSMTQTLAEQLVGQYGTARVSQVLTYMQKPENSHLKIGWLRSQLKTPTAPFDTVRTPPVLTTPDDLSEGDIETQADATSADSSIYSVLANGRTAEWHWNAVAGQLVGKGYADLKTATLTAYDAASQTYTVQVASARLQQQLSGRYKKVVNATLTGLHTGASVVFVVREEVAR